MVNAKSETSKQQRRRFLGALAAWPAAISPVGTAWAASAADNASSERLRRLLDERLRHQGVGLQAFEIDGDGPRLAAAGATPPLDREGLFEIGSITKTFMALLLADASLRGELRLDDPLEPVIDLQLRDSEAQPLRWIDLATHRSGLPRLPANLQPKSESDPYADYGWAGMQIFLRGWQPKRPRGAAFEYSNLGFGLLGQALSLKTGMPLDVLLRERVTKPLGLGATRLTPARNDLLVPGHDGKGQPVPAWRFDPAMAGAGAVLASVQDLARYAQAALGQLPGKPLAEAFALCQRRHAEGANPANPIGLAWMLAPLNERTVNFHDGGTGGFRTSLWLDPQRGRAAGVLANATVEVTDLALHLLEPSIPAKNFAITQQAALSLPAAQLAGLGGVYAFNSSFKLRITARGERLFAQATGQGEFELFAKAARQFFARITPLEIVFDGEPGSTAAALTLHQGAQTLRFVREP